MHWAASTNGYFLSEPDAAGAGAGVVLDALGAAVGVASLPDEPDASMDEPDNEPESLLLSFLLADCGLAWL